MKKSPSIAAAAWSLARVTAFSGLLDFDLSCLRVDVGLI